MRKLSVGDFEEIKLWMYRNARQIELALWEYYFEGGSKEAVLSSLAYYQNEDGGFGHALEADSWNPNSSPYTTLQAINILQGIEFIDKKHPILEGIFRYLESTPFCSEKGWYFSIPTNNDYAHAPWWTYNVEANAVEGIGVTAELAGFILKNGDRDSKIYKRALTFSDEIINTLKIPEYYGDMGIGGCCLLFESIKKAQLTDRFDCDFLMKRLAELINGSIERDTSKWVNYSVRPSDYISCRESTFYKGNEEIVAKELDYLIETRPQNGVWDITWSWFENNDKFMKAFAISENWWKATKAIHKIKYLRSFDRIE